MKAIQIWRCKSRQGSQSCAVTALVLKSRSPVHPSLRTLGAYTRLFVSASLCLRSNLACNLSWRWALITDISPESACCIVGVSAPFIPSAGALGKVTLHITHCLANQWVNRCLICVRGRARETQRCTCALVCVMRFVFGASWELISAKTWNFNLDLISASLLFLQVQYVTCTHR